MAQRVPGGAVDFATDCVCGRVHRLLFVQTQPDIKIGPQTIQIGKKIYSRDVPIEFRVDRHYKALKEDEYVQGDKTYSKAIEAVMQYGERRIQIAEMWARDQEKAAALIIRIGNWCEGFDEAMNKQVERASPETVSPHGDFGQAPDVL